MKTIKIWCARYKGQHRIFLKVLYDPELIRVVKDLPDARWNPDKRAWHIMDSPVNYREMEEKFKDRAVLDTSGITKNINNERLISAHLTDKPEIIESIKDFKRYLIQQRYSEDSIKSYTEALGLFLCWIEKPIEEITNDDLLLFNDQYIIIKKYGRSYQNQIISAIKLYFSTMKSKNFKVELIERPRREKKLPSVLNKDEVKKLLYAHSNIKHKTMLSLIYACGLRCGELIKLRPDDLDIQRGVLTVREGKGMKDRVINLSGKIYELVKDYHEQHKPKVWLFEGAKAGHVYSKRSLQNVIKGACKKAGINKPVTLHWLRHSYATHLMDSGVNLRSIQKLLGHSNIKTTEIYTHVSNIDLGNIKSPFDDL